MTIIDDDENIVASLTLALERYGHVISARFDGESGLQAITEEACDLAILDIKLPRLDGLEVLRRLRLRSALPVIVITSNDEELDEILGLGLGADDYIRKPFSQRILVERVKALLRRATYTQFLNDGDPRDSGEIPKPKRLNRGKMILDLDRHECLWNGNSVKLTVTEFLIVGALAQRPGLIKGRDILISAAFDETTYLDDRNIDSHIKRIRRKFWALDPDFDLIETVYGAGYRYSDRQA